MSKTPPSQERAPQLLIGSVRFLAALGGIAMASTGQCEILFIAVFFSFFLLGLKIEKLPQLSRFMGVVQPYLAVLVFGISLIDFFLLSKSFLLSVAHFLLCLQGLQLLVLRTTRENLGGVLISSLMILSASTLAVEWTFFAMFCVYLPVLIWTLMLHTILVENQSQFADDQEPSPYRLNATSPLWRRMIPILRRSAAAAFLIAVGCCTFIFITFPRFNLRGFRGQFLQPIQKTGFTNQVDLGKSRKIYTDDSIVMRVEISDEDFNKWNGYLRGSTLEVFDGRIWKKAPYPTERIYQTGWGNVHLPLWTEEPGERISQSIYLESMDSPILFALSRPAHLEIDRPLVELGSDGTIQRPLGDSWRIHYRVDSFLPRRPAPVSLKMPSAFPPGSNARSKITSRRVFGIPPGLEFYSYALPKVPLGRLDGLATDLTAGSNNDFEIAKRIESHLQNNYKYSLDFPLKTDDENPVETFLFDLKKGNCEYFASAMCLMLRYKNIPARIVTGFYSKEWNEQGGYFVVRMKNAHAWIEAYIEPYGWVSFDPTPRSDISGAFGSELARRWEESWDYLNLRWNRYILSYDFERQRSIVESVVDRSGKISQQMAQMGGIINSFFASSLSKKFSFWPKLRRSNEDSEFSHWIPYLSILFILAVVYFYGQRRRHRPRVWFLPPLLRYLESKGGRKPDFQTLREFSNSLEPEIADKYPMVQFLENRYYFFRFNPSAEASREETAAIRDALKTLR